MKVAIVGAGGINSWFIKTVSDMIDKEQVPLQWEFFIFDGDNVESKNLSYQNFEFADLLKDKSAVLGNRYGMHHAVKYITTDEELAPYDVVVCGVDNRKFRELLFRHMHNNPAKHWIDMRAEGRAIAIYADGPKNNLETMLATLGDPTTDDATTSCQLEYELSAGVVQLGNRIIADIGAQFLLNLVRGETNPTSFNRRF